MTLQDYLHDGIAALGLALSLDQENQLLQYCELLQKWNKVYNLTRILESRDMIDKHLLDSLSIVSLMSGNRFLDVGSGAGLPGIPISIARPEWVVTCLDSVGKKTRFMTQVKAELNLSNVNIVHSRLEEYHPPQGFDMIISRAFQGIADTVEICSHLNHHYLLLMKGQAPAAEIVLPAAYKIQGIVKLSVPHVDDARHAIIIERIQT